MPNKNKIEITLQLPLDSVVERLNAARKEMAPKIGTCSFAPDRSWFVCTVSYGYVYALVTGQQVAGTEECKVSVQTKLLSIKPLLAIAIGLGAVSIFRNRWSRHPKAIWEWFSEPILIAFFVAIPIFLAPFCKLVLLRFVQKTLLNPPES